MAKKSRKNARKEKADASMRGEYTADQKEAVKQIVLAEQVTAYTAIKPKVPDINLTALANIFRALEKDGVVTKGGTGKVRQVLLKPDGSKKSAEELAAIVINVMPRKKRRKARANGASHVGKFSLAEKLKKLGDLAGHYGQKSETGLMINEVIIDLKGGAKASRLEKDLSRIHQLAAKHV